MKKTCVAHLPSITLQSNVRGKLGQKVPEPVYDFEEIDKIMIRRLAKIIDSAELVTLFEELSEYIGRIYHVRVTQSKTVPISKNNFKNAVYLNHKMRAILIDWLWEVAVKFKLEIETMFLTIQLIDMYITKNKHVERNSLQLVGVGCMLLACKHEEIYFPEIRDFVYICDKAYTRAQICAFEPLCTSTLEFPFLTITPWHIYSILIPIVCSSCQIFEKTPAYMFQFQKINYKVGEDENEIGMKQLMEAVALKTRLFLGLLSVTKYYNWYSILEKTVGSILLAIVELDQPMLTHRQKGHSLQAIRKMYSSKRFKQGQVFISKYRAQMMIRKLEIMSQLSIQNCEMWNRFFTHVDNHHWKEGMVLDVAYRKLKSMYEFYV